jgi:hypothetical protein
MLPGCKTLKILRDSHRRYTAAKNVPTNGFQGDGEIFESRFHDQVRHRKSAAQLYGDGILENQFPEI